MGRTHRPGARGCLSNIRATLRGSSALRRAAITKCLGRTPKQAVYWTRGKEFSYGNQTATNPLLRAKKKGLHFCRPLKNYGGRRAALNLGEYPKAAETYLRLALKAQSQCRTTLESLAEIRNPRPVAFVKQANIAHGHQQVNNGDAAYQAEYDPARAEVENGQSKLLEENANVTRLDTRASGKTGSGDTPLEALGAVNRSRLGTGKGSRVA